MSAAALLTERLTDTNHTPGAAYRDPLAGLHGELRGELEGNGCTVSHLPLQLPVGHVLVLQRQNEDVRSFFFFVIKSPQYQMEKRQQREKV